MPAKNSSKEPTLDHRETAGVSPSRRRMFVGEVVARTYLEGSQAGKGRIADRGIAKVYKARRRGEGKGNRRSRKGLLQTERGAGERLVLYGVSSQTAGCDKNQTRSERTSPKENRTVYKKLSKKKNGGGGE